MKFLRFASKAEARAAFSPWLEPESGAMPAVIGSVAVVEVGAVTRPTGQMLETPDGPVPAFAPVPGWHINLSSEVQELRQFEIEPPDNPSRVFAGAWPPPAPPVPQEVTMAQCRLALYDLQGIETDEQFFELADLLPEAERPRALLELRTRPTVRIDSPLVQALAQAMGWDLDALFIYAAQQ